MGGHRYLDPSPFKTTQQAAEERRRLVTEQFGAADPLKGLFALMCSEEEKFKVSRGEGGVKHTTAQTSCLPFLPHRNSRCPKALSI
jgi:hypothetical protein